MRVLIACEFSGIVRDAFVARGHEAWSCDLVASEREAPHIHGDVLSVIRWQCWDLMIAFPPCTYLCTTGNKWFKPEYKDRFPRRHEQRKEAIAFFMSLAKAPIRQICIENPVGIMSTEWRKPNQIVQPYYFGHDESKKTCLWLKNLPRINGVLQRADRKFVPEYITMKSGKRLPKWFGEPTQSAARQRDRSRTFQLVADAMAKTWG